MKGKIAMQAIGIIIVVILIIVFVIYVVLPAVLLTIGVFASYCGLRAIMSVGIHGYTAVRAGHSAAIARPVTDRTLRFIDQLYQPQPARMMYPLDGGWYVLYHLSRELWGPVRTDAKLWVTRGQLWWTRGRTNDNLIYMVGLITISIGSFIGAGLYYAFAGIFWAGFLLLSSIGMGLWALSLSLMMLVIAAITWAYGTFYRLFHRCPKCHSQSRIPIYECPKCAVQHTRLWPSAYGVWSHTCECGTQLSTLHISGRSDYTQICPECGEIMHGRGSVVHVPIFGGPSAGKSHFLINATHAFVNDYVGYGKMTVRFPSQDEQVDFNARWKLLSSGKTLPKTGMNTANSVDGYNLELHHPSSREPCLLYFYDMMGEHASLVETSIDQKFFNFRESGVVLVLDPFSFDEVKRQYRDRPGFDDLRASTTPPNQIVDNLINTMNARQGNRKGGNRKNPLAVVVTKVDAMDIQERIDNALQKSVVPPSLVDDDAVKTSRKVQAFLYGIDPMLIKLLEQEFRTVRYFAKASLYTGSESKPDASAMTPLVWILGQLKVIEGVSL